MPEAEGTEPNTRASQRPLEVVPPGGVELNVPVNPPAEPSVGSNAPATENAG